MMTCREVIDFLMDYSSGELDPAIRKEFERHLGLCPPCVAYLDTYQKTVELEKSLCDPDGAAPPIPEDLVQAILSARAAARKPGSC